MNSQANHNRVLDSMRHLNEKYEQISARQRDFLRREADGDKPDPNEFTQLLQQQSVTATAMTAQFGLYQKPLKTVLSDSR